MNRVHKSIVLTGFTITILSIFLITIENKASAQTFGIHKFEEYGIQFQTPTDWTITEKQSRFEEGTDLTVRSPDPLGASFAIDYDDAITLFGTDNIQDAITSMIPNMRSTFYKYDLKVVETPHIVTIGNKTGGTGVFAAKQKYEDTPTTIALQLWFVIDGSKGYMIMYMDSPSTFDSEENTKIREHFIKFIRFIGNTEIESSTNSTSRFEF